MRRLSDVSLGVRLGAAFALIIGLLLVVAGVGLSGGSSQGAAAQKLDSRLRQTQEVMQVKFRDADFNGWQTAYAFDIVRGVKGATADSAASRRAFLASAASFRQRTGRRCARAAELSAACSGCRGVLSVRPVHGDRQTGDRAVSPRRTPALSFRRTSWCSGARSRCSHGSLPRSTGWLPP